MAAIFGEPCRWVARDGGGDIVEWAVMTALRPQYVRVAELYYGLEDGHPRFLREVGALMRLSRARIGQIKFAALRRLRHPKYSRPMRAMLVFERDAEEVNNVV